MGADDAQYPSPRYAWYVIFVLMVAYTLSYIDRQILSLLVDPIRADLNLSNTEFSLLHGLAFALFYTIVGIPLARVADNGSRRGLMAVGIFAWSVMTAVCGLAKNFWQLFLARVGVGVGEAALSPAAYSMIADCFPPKRLGLALGTYAMGVYFGIGLAFMIGGAVVEMATQATATALPVVGELKPWQLTFVYVGVPGILVSLWVYSLREPKRQGIGTERVPVSEIVKFFKTHRATLLGHFFAFSLLTLMFNGNAAWAPAYFMRVHDAPVGEIGLWLGGIIFVFGSLGIVSGGWLGDYLTSKGHTDGTLRASLVGAIAIWPFAVAAPLMPDRTLSLLLFCPMIFFSSFPFGVATAALQIVVPNRMRGQISALFLFVVNLTGIGLGATVVALLMDKVFVSDLAVGKSMALVSLFAAPAAALVLWWVLPRYRASLVALRAQSSPAG